MKWHAFSQSDLDGKLAHAAYMGSPTEVARLIADGANPRADDSEALLYAATEGHLECVKLLIPHSDPMADASRALLAAVEHGHQEVAMLLIPHSDCRANDSEALVYAAGTGQSDLVNKLLPHSDLEAAYRSCIERGRTDVGDIIRGEQAKLESKFIHSELGTDGEVMEARKTRRM